MSAIFGETLTFEQGNGGNVELVVYGDEFYARYETKNGYTVVYDTDRKKYCYAVLLGGRFTSSGTPITKPPPLGIRRHLKESGNVRNEKFERRYSRIRAPEPPAAVHYMRSLGANEGLLQGRRVSEGNVKGLTVLVEFADMATSVTAADVDAMLNADNYKKNGNFCSVREYFYLMSGGKLNYTNLVVGPVTLSQNRSYYINTLLVEEALDKVVNDMGVDLSQFDSRGEGIVDALNFMYAGRSVYSGDLWPHNSWVNLQHGNMRTHFYMLTSLGRRPVDLSIGTFCHENGHQLCRMPDFYDYGTRDGDFERSHGMGRYCLMGSGNHLNSGRTPSPVCAYFRYLVDWYDQEVLLDGHGTYEARHGDYSTIIKHETDKPNEYFLIENRTQLALDTYLPDGGLAVYHCDTLGSNEWQGGTAERHYQCGLLQADGHLDLENNRNRGDAGDLYGQVDGVALSHETTPSSREWDGTDSELMISDISAPAETISFIVGEPTGVLVVEGYVTADELIPDNDPTGISRKIEITQTGRVKALEVCVDITHTYIGDLEVELEAPSGKKAVLHKRSGGRADDLKVTYSSDSKQELAAMTNESICGDWTLHVRDRVGQDVGRLNSWGIKIKYEKIEQVIQAETAPNLAIPDKDNQGVTSSISVAETGTVKEVSVGVEITHPYIGDLHVELVAPSGHSVTLHYRSGGSRNNLKTTYDSSSVPELETLVDEQIRGDWTLRVRDLAWFDWGTLDKWSLTLVC